MIVVEDIKYRHVRGRDEIRICDMPDISLDCEPLPYVEPITHNLKGRTFVNENGDRVVIALHPKVADAIGLPFRVYEDLKASELTLSDALYESRGHLRKYTQATFLQRLRYLIKGEL